jgi:hypothetical protein
MEQRDGWSASAGLSMEQRDGWSASAGLSMEQTDGWFPEQIRTPPPFSLFGER